ncbi:MAG: TonB-dependent receptor [Deltaproteobacteria bacterium]|nr:TonB-dependent receptor [Deltaproteobacteria bacterium]
MTLRCRAALLLPVVLFAAREVRADARAEAKRHFRTGMALIDKGDPRAGIAELERAYALKPHPAVQFNIGRAAEALGDHPRALAAYRLYLASAPADSADVEARMARVEARSTARAPVLPPAPPAEPAPAVTATPQPPGAETTLPIPEPPPGADPPTLRAAAALARALAGALQPDAGTTAPLVEAPPAPDAGTAVADAGPVESVQPDAGAALPEAPAGEMESIYAERSVTAARTEADVMDSPAFVTVITREELEQSGFRTIPEALRRIPGITVAQMTQSDFNVTLRGLNRRLANKVLVLVDGRSVYQDFLGGTAWEALPVELQDVERIEVVRGPGAALYGASAFGGVVNIITRTAEASGVEASGEAGLPRQGRLALRTTGLVVLPRPPRALTAGCRPLCWLLGRSWSDTRVTGAAGGGVREAQREELPRSRPDLFRLVDPADVSGRAGRLWAAVEVQAAPEHRVRVEGGLVRLRQDLNALGSLRNYVLDGMLGWAQARWLYGPVSLRAFYTGVDLQAQPELTPRRPDPLRTRVITHLLDVEPVLNLPFRLLGDHRVVAGAGWRLKAVEWSYLDGRHVQNLVSAFAQETWAPVPWLSLVGSYRVDRHPLAPPVYGDIPLYGRLPVPPLPGLSHSARLAATVRVLDTSLRVAAATAFRDPTFMESYVDFALPLTVEGAVLSFQGSHRLLPERIASLEVGSSTRLADRLALDTALYLMAVDRLIGMRAPEVDRTPGVDDTGRFVIGRGGFENSGNVLLGGGAEVLLRLFPLDGVDLDVGWAGHRLFGTRAVMPWDLAAGSAALPQPGDFRARLEDPPYRLVAALRMRAPLGLEGGVDASLTGPTTWHEETIDPASPTGVRLDGIPVDPYLNTSVRVGWRLWGGAAVVSAVGQNLLAPVHREHPFGDRVGPRALVTLALRP